MEGADLLLALFILGYDFSVVFIMIFLIINSFSLKLTIQLFLL